MRPRQLWLLIVPIVLGLLSSCKNFEQPGSTETDRNLSGAWRTRIQFAYGSFAAVKDLEFMYVINDGGTMTESSNYDAAPPVPPAYGTWRWTGGNQYELKSEFFASRVPDSSEHLPISNGWLPAGRGDISEIIDLASDGKSYTSKIHYKIYDRSGGQVQDSGDGTGSGVRIEF